MKFSTLLEADLASINGGIDLSWHNIKSKLNYLLDTRNVIYLDKVNASWQSFISCNAKDRNKNFKNILICLEQEEALRLYISKTLSLYRNKDIAPENMANFLQVQQNFSKLLGCENIHIDNILLYAEWLLESVLLIKQHALKKINDEEKQKSANAESDALIMQIKDYQSTVCTNILIRLEVMAKYGVIHKLGMMAIADINGEIINLNNYNLDVWDENKFQKYYLFVMQQGNCEQVGQLKQLLFDFGTIYIRADSYMAAYPKIYTKDELLLVKPWFGWLRWGVAARYSLFEQGFLQIELNTKIKLAESRVKNFEYENMLRMQDRIYDGLGAVQAEKARVGNVQKYLWHYLYAKEYELCERWQVYLLGVSVNIQKTQLLQLQELTGNYDSMLSLMLNKSSVSVYASVFQSLLLASDSGLRVIANQIYNNFSKSIFIAIMQGLFRYDLRSKQCLQALNNFFEHDIADDVASILGVSYDDAKLLFNSLGNIDDAKALFALIIKYLTVDDYIALLREFFTVEIASNGASIIMQAYLNRRCVAGHFIPNTVLQDLQVLCADGAVLVNPYVADFNITDKYYEKLETILLQGYKNSTIFLKAVSGALAMYNNMVLSYRLRLQLGQQLESQLRVDCLYDAAYLPMILEYGKLETKKQYCLGIFEAKLSAIFSLNASLIACNYYEIIKYDNQFGGLLKYELQQILTERLTTNYAQASVMELRQLFTDIGPGHSIITKLTLSQQELINTFIAMQFATSWSSSSSYLIGLFGSDKVKSKYYLKLIRALAIYVSYDKDLKEALAYLKFLSEDSCYYWRCFGLQDANISEVLSHISFVIASMKHLDDRVAFLDFIFSNRYLVQFYKLTELQLAWENKKLLLVDQQRVKSLLAKLVVATPNTVLSAHSHLDDLLEVIILLEKNNFVFHDVESMAEIISQVISFIWEYFRLLIEQSIISNDLSELMKYKTQIIIKLAQYKFLTIEQQYELKFLAWLATMQRYILNSNVYFWHLSQGIQSGDMNCLKLYLYWINYYPKQYAKKIHAVFLPYKKYMSREGLVRMFCENIDNYQSGEAPFAVSDVPFVVSDSEPQVVNPHLKLQLSMVAELKNIDCENIAIIERERATDSLNYLIEFAASEKVEAEARVILNKLAPDLVTSNSYSPSFFS